ncbi:MAG: DUF342 domain-containing protein, partial [Nitrospinae bacterium]|nr:DUF342 domain-containing protein [Nitrospinota bacterium]
KKPKWLFEEFVLVKEIKAGDCIAEITPATFGKNGVTIFGVELLTIPGEDLNLKGKNIEVRENKVFSTIQGRVILKDHDIDVEPILRVEKGDKRAINFDGSVEFLGGIRELPPVKATGDIVVHGSVEHTSLIAGRNILIHGNLASSHKLAISAGSDFAAINISHAKIEAENILLLSSSLDSELLAYHGIVTLTANSQLVGGHGRAGRLVLSQIIGNEREIPTLISVATPKIMSENREQILAPYRSRLHDIKKESGRISRRISQIETVKKEAQEREKKVYSTIEEKLQGDIEECEKKETAIFKNIVRIKDPKYQMALGDISANKFYPQTTLYMGHCERHISDIKEKMRYHLKESNIYTESFDKK